MDNYHDAHIEEEMLERYALNQLNEEQSAPLEEHLLVCSKCQDRLDAVDEYVQTMKQSLKDKPAAKGGHVFQKPRLALVFAGALAFAGALLVLPVRRIHMAPVDVRLHASRGGDSLPIVEAQSGAPLILHMDATEIVSSDVYSVEVVNARGKRVWRGSASPHANELSVEVSSDLQSGRYWIRLFDSSKPPVLIREYGLELN